MNTLTRNLNAILAWTSLVLFVGAMVLFVPVAVAIWSY